MIAVSLTETGNWKWSSSLGESGRRSERMEVRLTWLRCGGAVKIFNSCLEVLCLELGRKIWSAEIDLGVI